ncbi:MAG: hypothetical protein ACREIT_08310, partial [Tepidisphaeraceae bacterium]
MATTTDRDRPRGPGREMVRADGVARFVIPALVFVVPAVVTVLLYCMQRWEERNDVAGKTAVERLQLARRLERILHDDIRPLRRLAREVGEDLLRLPSELATAAESVRGEIPAYKRMVWADADDVVRGVSPDADEVSAIGVDLSRHPSLARPLRQARVTGGITAETTGPTHDPGDDLWIFCPAWSEDDTYLGAVVGQLDLRRVLGELLDRETRHLFEATLHKHAHEAEVEPPPPVGWSAKYPTFEPVVAFDQRWHLHVSPTPGFIAQESDDAPSTLLYGGLALS